MGVIIFFYYFFDDLYYIEDIQRAFKQICLEKMLSDGYFDMNAYISGRIKKEDMYAKLVSHHSKYAVLYKGSYPKQNNAATVWWDKVGNQPDEEEVTEMTFEESSAIVNWVYRTLSNAQERRDFTEELFRQIKDLYNIQNNIRFSKGVVYNEEKVELHFISSVSEVNRFISLLGQRKENLFFRGHSNANYILQPSIMRTQRLRQNESSLYHELLINCPADFEKCHTHLEKLVKMQHYGLPTRLLDITRNPLVALYFACASHRETYGELVLISAENHEIKYPQSDMASILASLPVFPYHKQENFRRLASDPEGSNREFNVAAAQLIHEIRIEKPAFQPEIDRKDLLKSYIVYALKDNGRIVKQDGAFILCGLSADAGLLEDYRYMEHGKKVIVLVEEKAKILEQLDVFSINKATLFPEIECVAEYLKGKYMK